MTLGKDPVVPAKPPAPPVMVSDPDAVTSPPSCGATIPAGMDEAAEVAQRLDAAVANGSSIAFVAEYGDRRCAFLGDAHAPTISSSLSRMAKGYAEDRLRLDAVKLAHHGSEANTTTTLLRKIDCHNYLVSTDGSIFGHPDDTALKRVVREARPATLFFNYASERTIKWRDPHAQASLNYRAFYPVRAESGIEVDLLATSSSAA